MATLQMRIDDTLKQQAEAVLNSLGLDTTTGIRIFLNAVVEYDGIPFPVQHRTIPPSLQQAIDDTRNQTNLYGPFDTAEEAVASMLEN